MKFVALVLVLSAAAFAAGCGSGGRVARPSAGTVKAALAPASPLPAATARKLPPGVFYFEGGPFGAPPPWVSIWRVAAGHETLVTKGQAGRQVDLFAAARAGIVVSDNAGSVAGLARWTSAGPQWLHPWSKPGIGIAGQAPSISSDGTIAYLLAPAGARGTGDTTIWIRRDWDGRDRIVFRANAARYPLMPLFGPRGELALVSIDQATKGHPDVVVLNRNDQVIRRLHSGFGRLGLPQTWGSRAPALALRASAGQAELLYLNGRRRQLPPGWKPLAWSPSGRALLMMSRTSLGIWSEAKPGQVATIGPVNRGYGIWQASWLASSARM